MKYAFIHRQHGMSSLSQRRRAAGAYQGHPHRDSRGVRVGKGRVRKLMHLHSIRAKGKRRFKVTTNSNHDLPIAANLLDREFSVVAPDRVWTGDITYIATNEGWLFLAVVIDLFSRKVVGWALAAG